MQIKGNKAGGPGGETEAGVCTCLSLANSLSPALQSGSDGGIKGCATSGSWSEGRSRRAEFVAPHPNRTHRSSCAGPIGVGRRSRAILFSVLCRRLMVSAAAPSGEALGGLRQASPLRTRSSQEERKSSREGTNITWRETRAGDNGQAHSLTGLARAPRLAGWGAGRNQRLVGLSAHL